MEKPKIGWCVDGSSIGNPGESEYRCVDISTGKQIFRYSFGMGTNNIAEFLAIVHALALTKKQNIVVDVYSDSNIAIGWVKKKETNTSYKDNEEANDLIKRAENWLKNNTYTNQIMKWETKAWGETPADFGRKL